MSQVDVMSGMKMFEGAEVVGVDDPNNPEIDLSQIVFFDSESDFSSPGQENDHDCESRQALCGFIKQEKELVIIDQVPMIISECRTLNERDVPAEAKLEDCQMEEEEQQQQQHPDAEESQMDISSSSLSSLADHQYSIPQSQTINDSGPYDDVIRNIIETSKSEANNNTIELLLNFVDVLQSPSNNNNSEFLDAIKFALQSRKGNGENAEKLVATIKQEEPDTLSQLMQIETPELSESNLLARAKQAGKKYMENLDKLDSQDNKGLKTCLRETRTELTALSNELKMKLNLLHDSQAAISDESAVSFSSDSDSSTLRHRRKKLTKTRKFSRDSAGNDEPKTAKSEESKKVRPSINDDDIQRLLDLDTLETRRVHKSDKPPQDDDGEPSTSAGKVKTKKKNADGTDAENFFGSSSEDNTSDESSDAEAVDEDTSDEEEKLLKRHEDMIKAGLLADSDVSESSSDSDDLADFLKTSDEEDVDIPPKLEPVDNTPSDDPPVEQAKPTSHEKTTDEPESVIRRTSSIRASKDSDSSDNEQNGRVPKKKVRRTSAEKEIFDKNLLKSPGTSTKSNQLARSISTSSKDSTKTDLKSPSKSTDVIPEVGVDVSMFNSVKNRTTSLDFSAERVKKNDDVKPARSSTVSELSKMLIDDECISLSSETDSEISVPIGEEQAKKKFPRRKKILSEAELQEETKKARKTEKERLERLKRKNENLTQLSQSMMSQRLSQNEVEPLILDIDKDGNTIRVHDALVSEMKPHQKDGVKFMYDSCYGSLKDDVKTESGCILAHSMGLGKTLQVVSLVHVLITHEQLKTKKILIVCPKVTIINWKEEFELWLKNLHSKGLRIAYNADEKSVTERVEDIERWYNSDRPGVFLINYEAFRNLVHFNGRRGAAPLAPERVTALQEKIKRCLLDPGPDLVVCDEGHMIKNEKSSTNRAITQIRTMHRIILTGTPVQNNLTEYYTMVNFAKPGILGTLKEFNNVFNNPIKDGQHIDSTPGMIKRMKQRSLVLNKNLSAFVQRKESSELAQYLPDKHEYVLFVPLTKKQEDLYKYFLSAIEKERPKILNDYTALRKIWTHPRVLKNAHLRALNGEVLAIDQKKQDRQEESDDVLDRFEGDVGVKSNWFEKFVNGEDLDSILSSNKMILLFKILELAEERGEKVLIFSNFVAVLNVVEELMQLIHAYNQNPSQEGDKFGYKGFKSSWVKYRDYIRLDGSTKREERQRMIKAFNDESNKRLRCFLISAKAGGQGINLTGANRCIILDTSWNPSSDQQNIFRIYRLGQTKPCYAYRIIAMGTMEEIVYSRAVTKQATSGRVVDKRQIDRHYRMEELTNLYKYNPPDFSKREQFIPPEDVILKRLLYFYHNLIFKYHCHDSLLEDKPEQGLTTEEIDEAWEQYQNEITRGKAPNPAVHNINPNLAGPLMTHGIDYSDFTSLASIFNPLLSPFAGLQYPSLTNLGLFGALPPIMPSTSGGYLMEENPYMSPMFSDKKRKQLSQSLSQRMVEKADSRKRTSTESKSSKSSSETVSILPDEESPEKSNGNPPNQPRGSSATSTKVHAPSEIVQRMLTKSPVIQNQNIQRTIASTVPKIASVTSMSRPSISAATSPSTRVDVNASKHNNRTNLIASAGASPSNSRLDMPASRSSPSTSASTSRLDLSANKNPNRSSPSTSSGILSTTSRLDLSANKNANPSSPSTPSGPSLTSALRMALPSNKIPIRPSPKSVVSPSTNLSVLNKNKNSLPSISLNSPARPNSSSKEKSNIQQRNSTTISPSSLDQTLKRTISNVVRKVTSAKPNLLKTASSLSISPIVPEKTQQNGKNSNQIVVTVPNLTTSTSSNSPINRQTIQNAISKNASLLNAPSTSSCQRTQVLTARPKLPLNQNLNLLKTANTPVVKVVPPKQSHFKPISTPQARSSKDMFVPIISKEVTKLRTDLVKQQKTTAVTSPVASSGSKRPAQTALGGPASKQMKVGQQQLQIQKTPNGRYVYTVAAPPPKKIIADPDEVVELDDD